MNLKCGSIQILRKYMNLKCVTERENICPEKAYRCSHEIEREVYEAQMMVKEVYDS